MSPPSVSGDATQYHKFVRSLDEVAFFDHMKMLTLGAYLAGRNRGFAYGFLCAMTGSLIFFSFWR